MATITTEFNEKGYVSVSGLVSPQTCKSLVERLNVLVSEGKTVKDDQCPLSDAAYGDPVFDDVLQQLLKPMSEISGKRLLPTYSYARMYRKGEVLAKHRDRPACEISATLTLGTDKDWGIYFSVAEIENAEPVYLQPGELCVYKGTELYHWRDAFEGEWQAQVFLHYVDADGPYAEEKFDRRDVIGGVNTPPTKTEFTPLYYWYFNDAVESWYIDAFIKSIAQGSLQKAQIGFDNGVLDLSTRNVEKLMLHTSSGIGGMLAGVALSANSQAWKFDVTHCDQAEYLQYGVGGRYKSHVDTFIGAPYPNCRKLTALAFLNDDYEGGRFYLQLAEGRIYPPQCAGTILVFPSFMLHGVEDVTSGIRRTVVAWMLGPYFK
jgi:hypothetical protein